MIIFTEIQNLLGFSCQQNYASCYNPPAKLKITAYYSPFIFAPKNLKLSPVMSPITWSRVLPLLQVLHQCIQQFSLFALAPQCSEPL